jgi:cardiolipin synthase
MPTLPDGPRDGEAVELARLAQATTHLPPTSAREVRLLVDGAAKYEALLASIAEATTCIDIAYYIYEPDHTGTAIRDALVERLRAGVKVRLLLDAVGSAKASRRFFAPFVDAGGELAWFHPMRLRWRRPWLNLRLHRKIVVVDDRVAFTGGINVTDEQDERRDDEAYHDLHLRLEGDVVALMKVVFMEDWVYATGQRASLPAPGPAPSAASGAISTQVLVSGPDSSWESIHRLHVSAIYAAKRRVWLATPYFVPGEAAMMALTSAALGGLDVRLLVPKLADSRLVTFATRSSFDELLDAGVKVYEYGPRLLHTKALLVDDDTAIIGSANFDHRSFRLNFEVSLLFHDAGLARELEGILEDDLRHAPRVRADRRRSFWRSRLPEALARLLSPLL